MLFKIYWLLIATIHLAANMEVNQIEQEHAIDPFSFGRIDRSNLPFLNRNFKKVQKFVEEYFVSIYLQENASSTIYVMIVDTLSDEEYYFLMSDDQIQNNLQLKSIFSNVQGLFLFYEDHPQTILISDNGDLIFGVEIYLPKKQFVLKTIKKIQNKIKALKHSVQKLKGSVEQMKRFVSQAIDNNSRLKQSIRSQVQILGDIFQYNSQKFQPSNDLITAQQITLRNKLHYSIEYKENNLVLLKTQTLTENHYASYIHNYQNNKWSKVIDSFKKQSSFYVSIQIYSGFYLNKHNIVEEQTDSYSYWGTMFLEGQQTNNPIKFGKNDIVQVSVGSKSHQRVIWWYKNGIKIASIPLAASFTKKNLYFFVFNDKFGAKMEIFINDKQ